MEGTLLNRSVSVGLRLKLFNATVSRALLYCLETCPLTRRLLEKVYITQRKRLRKIIGWVGFADETENWEERGHRMKAKMERTLLSHPVPKWSEEIHKRKDALYERLQLGTTSSLTRRAANWRPSECRFLNHHYAHKGPGRPRVCWDD